MKKNDNESNNMQYLPIGMCLGLSVGLAIGSALGNVGVGMCFGIGIGLCFGSAMDAAKRKKSDEDQAEEQAEE